MTEIREVKIGSKWLPVRSRSQADRVERARGEDPEERDADGLHPRELYESDQDVCLRYIGQGEWMAVEPEVETAARWAAAKARFEAAR